MKLRVLALLALTGALVPLWASEVITHDMRVNRQRITTVLNVPKAFQPPQTTEFRQNRQRITSLNDIPGMVRDALPHDRQIDRSRIDTTPRPGLHMKPSPLVPVTPPGKGVTVPRLDVQPAKPSGKEEVVFLQDAAKDKDKPKDDGAKMREEKLVPKEWRCGRQLTDDKGRRWHLIQGMPHTDRPGELDGWIMQAADSPIYFFSKSGRMWRLTAMPLP
jgi:hypothetical protein